MEFKSNAWIDRWSDHLMAAFHEDSGSVPARNAWAIELGCMDGLPNEVLALFRINLGRDQGQSRDDRQVASVVVRGGFSDDPRLSASGKFPKSRGPLRAPAGVARFVEVRGVKLSSKAHDHPAQTGDGHGASAGSASSIRWMKLV